jgi:hypothetical protein
MNIDKLINAIQILVEEEVKRQLPKLLAETLKAKKTAMVTERNAPKEKKPMSMARAILGEDHVNKPKKTEVKYTKNEMINQILNETKNQAAYPGAPTDSYDEWPTMRTPIQNMNPATDTESIRASLAHKMGYGDMVSGTGLGVDTGNEVLNKAFNRDYSELVRRFDKK